MNLWSQGLNLMCSGVGMAHRGMGLCVWGMELGKPQRAAWYLAGAWVCNVVGCMMCGVLDARR